MVPQSYELSFGLTIVIIFSCIILFILAINLFVAILRFLFGFVVRLFKSDQKSSNESSETSQNEHSLETESTLGEVQNKGAELSTKGDKTGSSSPTSSSINKTGNKVKTDDSSTVKMRKAKSRMK